MTTKTKRRIELVGWTYNDFKLHWRTDGLGATGSRIFKYRKSVMYNDFKTKENKPLKVKVTIEEIK